MPSRKQLEEFTASFNAIANEAVLMAERHLPLNTMALPDRDPPTNPFENAAGSRPAGPPADIFGIQDIPPSDTGAVSQDNGSPGGEDLDFGAFLDTIPDDFSAPEDDTGIPDDLLSGFADEIEAGRADADAVPVAETAGDADFGVDDFDLDVSPDDTGPEGADSGPEAASFTDSSLGDADFGAADDLGTADDFAATDDSDAESAAIDDGGFDLDNLNFGDLSGDAVEAPDQGADSGPEAASFTDSNLGDVDFGAANDLGTADDFAAADVSDAESAFDMPGLESKGESFSLFSEDGLSPPADDAFTPDYAPPDEAPPEAAPEGPPDEEFLGGESLGGEEALGGEESPGGEETLGGEEALGGEESLGGESFELGGELPQESPADSFDNFNPDGSSADFGISDADLSIDDTTFSEPGNMDEFSLSGIDDIFSGAASAQTSGTASSGTRPKLEASGDVEEIQLSREELEKLEATLAAYPLNLRIACEELIAEQAVAPDMMSALIKKLTGGASPKETASLAEKILGRSIPIPRGFEKKSGAELEAEQSSFAYIFVHNFLPIFRIVVLCGLLILSLGYLVNQFIITPIRADNTYKRGYSRIEAGDYTQANVVFEEALRIRRIKKWFFRYAEGFRDARQYIDAENKYEQLLRNYPRDKQGALDYADLETNYLMNYEKADEILRHNILDYSLDDREGLLAQGDNKLLWGDNGRSDDGSELPQEVKDQYYEDARRAYARLMEKYGAKDEFLERMLKYFIRTDQLGQVLPLQVHFMSSRKSKISAAALTELGGYLLDKRFEETRGVPDENISRIEGLRALLLRAVDADPGYPEAHYQLSRYYSHYGNAAEERQALENAVRAFDRSGENSIHRISDRIEAQRRYAWLLTLAGELFPAEEQLVKGITIFEDALRRNLLSRSPRYGRLYADLGDLEYFRKDGNMAAALRYYTDAERFGWAPPEILYRTGAAHYQRQEWEAALEKFFEASSSMPLNRRILYALGNASFQRGDYYAAEGYYTMLLDLLDAERTRFPLLQPRERPEHMELAERIMVLRNNLGVTMDALADRTGNPAYRPRALAFYSESGRAWDTLTRDSETMIRMSPENSSGPGLNLGFLNSGYSLHPVPGFTPQIYTHIDKDVLEPSIWEQLDPPNYGLSGAIPFQVRER